jgi:hypothetical protein
VAAEDSRRVGQCGLLTTRKKGPSGPSFTVKPTREVGHEASGSKRSCKQQDWLQTCSREVDGVRERKTRDYDICHQQETGL